GDRLRDGFPGLPFASEDEAMAEGQGARPAHLRRGQDVFDVEALAEAAQGFGRRGIRSEVHRLAAGLEHQVGELAREVPGTDEARPADALPEGPERRTDALGVAAGRVEDAVDDEELVDAVLADEILHLRGDVPRVARPHALTLDHGIRAESALEVTATLGLEVRHAAPLEVLAVVDEAARHAQRVERRQPLRRVDRDRTRYVVGDAADAVGHDAGG